MTYKLKINILGGVIAALVLVLIFSFIFDPERIVSRSAAYSWLDPRQKDAIDRISINNGSEEIILVLKSGNWLVVNNGKEYPARQIRVDDFITALTKSAPYPVRSSSSSSHERLSLTGDGSVRVTVTGGAGRPLLDLLIGQSDVTGNELFMRKQGQNEVRSGEDIFSTYVNSSLNSWYNLRLFPETENGKLDVTSVQRLTVYPPAVYDSDSDDPEGSPGDEENPPRTFTRRNRTWTFNFYLVAPDMERVDSYIRDILNTSGDDFADYVDPSDPDLHDCRILLELGDGSIKTLRLGPEKDGKRFAVVTGSQLVYSVPGWAAQRLFPDMETFEKAATDLP